MPNPPVSKRRPTGSAGARPAVRPAAGPAAQGYVHFSDKMTGALKNINNVIDENKGTLDSIQDMAVELTRTVRMLREVVMKYVDMVDNVLEAAVPVMDRLPIVPEAVKDFAKDALALSKKITTASALAEKVLPGVESSLMSADVNGLQASKSDMVKLTKTLQDLFDDVKK